MTPEELEKKIKEQEGIIKELRDENAKQQLANRKISDELATVKADRDKVVKEKDDLSQSVAKMTTEHDAFKEESESKMAEATKSANQKIIAAEVAAVALQQGLVDRDALKLADLSKVEMAEDGTLKGADDLIKSLKEAKPYLFGATNSSSNPNAPPKPGAPQPVDAMKLGKEEYAKAKAEVLKAA